MGMFTQSKNIGNHRSCLIFHLVQYHQPACVFQGIESHSANFAVFDHTNAEVEIHQISRLYTEPESERMSTLKKDHFAKERIGRHHFSGDMFVFRGVKLFECNKFLFFGVNFSQLPAFLAMFETITRFFG